MEDGDIPRATDLPTCTMPADCQGYTKNTHFCACKRTGIRLNLRGRENKKLLNISTSMEYVFILGTWLLKIPKIIPYDCGTFFPPQVILMADADDKCKIPNASAPLRKSIMLYIGKRISLNAVPEKLFGD